MSENVSRQPIISQQSPWAKTLSEKMVAAQITPNQISQVAIGFAALALVTFALSGFALNGFLRGMLLLLGIIGCVGRVVCNVLDDMVANEGGLAESDSAFWNEAPDRLSDILIFFGVGIAADAPGLGLAAGAFAVGTAYIREFGRAEGFGSDHSGPMNKQYRMIAVIAGAVISILWSNAAMLLALIIVVLATIATIGIRCHTLMEKMQASQPSKIMKKVAADGDAADAGDDDGAEKDPEDDLMKRLKEMAG